MPMKKIEDHDRKDFYWRCLSCGYETEERMSEDNITEPPPRCPWCGK
jgi:hypothetical protein